MPTESSPSEAGAPIRAFIAINLPAEVKTRLGAAQRGLKSTPGGSAVRWTPAEQIHLTLRFLGHVPADSVADLQAALERAAESVVPFDVRAEGLGCFPNTRQPRIIWAGMSGAMETLQQLQQNVLRETSRWGEHEDRAFHPHLTIGRVRPEHARSARQLAEGLSSHTAAPFGVWRVEQMDLMQSTLSPAGAEHTRLISVRLTGTGATGAWGA